MIQRKQYTIDELESLSRSRINEICTSRGIEVSEETPDADVIRMVMAHQIKDSMNKEKAPEQKSKSSSVAVPVSKKTDRIWFKVMAGSQDHEKQDVFASLNGDTVLIKRNHWVKLPRRFVSVFENAVQSEFELGDNDQLIERKVPRFNIQMRSIEQGLPPEKSRPE